MALSAVARNRVERRAVRKFAHGALYAACIALPVLATGASGAESFPARPIRFVLSYGAPGGTPDIIARTLAAHLTTLLGQQIVIDPRPGAGGILAAEIVAGAAPDGYTIFLVSPSHLINTALHAKLSYDALKDFAPVTLVADVPNILSIHPSVSARNVRELIALAKARPGSLTYGSAGTGSSQHLSGELFKKMAGVDIVHVPYKVATAAVIDLIAGRINVSFASNSSLPHIKAGRLVGLAVTSAKRSSALPDLPTIAESGIPGYEASGWYGVLAPARTPKPIIAKLHDAVAKVLSAQDVRGQLAANTIEVAVSPTPSDFAVFLERENAKWGALVRESGARAD